MSNEITVLKEELKGVKTNVIKIENVLDGINVLTRLLTDNLSAIKDRFEITEGDVRHLKTENNLLKLKLEDQHNYIKNTNHTAMQALEKISLRDENDFGNDWLNQTDIGLRYEPSISSPQVGLILKQIGLAKKNSNKTIPLRIAHGNGWVRRGYAHNYTNWYYFYPIVKEKLIDYLKENDIYEEFLSQKTDDDMRDFIKTNFDRRVR